MVLLSVISSAFTDQEKTTSVWFNQLKMHWFLEAANLLVQWSYLRTVRCFLEKKILLASHPGTRSRLNTLWDKLLEDRIDFFHIIPLPGEQNASRKSQGTSRLSGKCQPCACQPTGNVMINYTWSRVTLVALRAVEMSVCRHPTARDAAWEIVSELESDSSFALSNDMKNPVCLIYDVWTVIEVRVTGLHRAAAAN